MPDLPTRRTREGEIAAALALAWRAWKLRIEKNPEAVDWSRFRDDTEGALILPLVRVYVEAARQLALEHGVPVDVRELEQHAQDWASGYVATLAGEITTSTRDMIDRAVIKAKMVDGMPLIWGIAIAFNGSRIARIAISETGRAITAGGRAIVRRFSLTNEETLVPWWYTEADGRVCEICAPLHNQREEAWQSMFPAGPPAHPRCRCWLEYKIEAALAA